MDRDTHTTKTIFRMWLNGSGCIALFPQMPGTNAWDTCGSYEHVGQHGAASPGLVMAHTRPATPAEYADLKTELESIGYNIQVASRCLHSDTLKRREQIAA